MKLHGGAFGSRGGYRPTKDELETENVEAVNIGAATHLDRHIRNMAGFGVPVIVSINRFTSDTDAEIAALTDAAHASGAREVTVTEVHSKGGAGGQDLANAVVKAVQDHVAAAGNNPCLVMRMGFRSQWSGFEGAPTYSFASLSGRIGDCLLYTSPSPRD